MTDAQLRTTRVDLPSLMTVLSNHLYSTPMVAVRELVQNAHDAVTRRHLEDPAFDVGSARILLSVRPGFLVISDNGAGLTNDEVVDFLATVGNGATKQLRLTHSDAPLIGMFGLGFLTAFAVADRVTVTTTSYQSPTTTHLYQSSSGETYSLATTKNEGIGTRVELRLKKEFKQLADVDTLRAVLSRYCALLPHAIAIDQDETALNAIPPPWRDQVKNQGADQSNLLQVRKDRFAFAERMDQFFQALGVIPVSQSEDSDVTGLLWLQDGVSYGSSDNRALTVFVRGMMLDDDARDLLPKWAGFVSGAIETRQLTPTASREDLQRDDAYDHAKAHLQQQLIFGLVRMSKEEPETWRRVLSRHNEALLGAALTDDVLFDLIADDVTIPTSAGDMLLRVCLRKSGQKFHVSLSPNGGFEEMLFRALQTPVVVGTRYAVLPFCERYVEKRGGQVIKLGTEGGNNAIFQPVTMTATQQSRLNAVFVDDDREVVAARFKPAAVPFVLVKDRDAELKARIENDEADKRISQAVLGLARLFTARTKQTKKTRLVVNVDNPAIVRLLAAEIAPPSVVILLQGLVALMAGSDTADTGALSSSLAAVSQVVASMFDPPATDPS